MTNFPPTMVPEVVLPVLVETSKKFPVELPFRTKNVVAASKLKVLPRISPLPL